MEPYRPIRFRDDWIIARFEREEKTGQIYAFDNVGFPIPLDKAREAAQLLWEYAETADPEIVEEFQREATYEIFLSTLPTYILDRDFRQDGPGWVFFCDNWHFYHTTKDPGKKRRELENKGLSIIHVFETTQARKLAVFLQQAVRDLWNLPEGYLIRRIINMDGFPKKAQELVIG